jgi:cytochrome P450
MSIESDDVWHRIAHMEIEGRQVSAIEFRGIVSVMLAGGRDTMVKMIAGILLHLGNNPSDKEMLISEPGLIDSAVQEFLRYLTPIPWMGRTTVPETGATNLPDDRYVNISFVSGNFDPEVFPDPTTINLRRERNSHVAFGFGPHTCIGNHLAEFEVRVFLQVLLSSNINWSISPDTAIMRYPDELSSVPLVIEKLFISL